MKAAPFSSDHASEKILKVLPQITRERLSVRDIFGLPKDCSHQVSSSENDRLENSQLC